MLPPPIINVYTFWFLHPSSISTSHTWLSDLLLFLVFKKENYNNGYGPPIINKVVHIWVMFLGASALCSKWEERGCYKHAYMLFKILFHKHRSNQNINFSLLAVLITWMQVWQWSFTYFSPFYWTIAPHPATCSSPGRKIQTRWFSMQQSSFLEDPLSVQSWIHWTFWESMSPLDSLEKRLFLKSGMILFFFFSMGMYTRLWCCGTAIVYT